MSRQKPTFVVLQRGRSGGLTRKASELAKQFAPTGFTFRRVQKSEGVVLRELQTALPKNVILPKSNPFAVLKVTPAPPNAPTGGMCMCSCGNADTCSGGGSGSSKPK